MDSAVGKPVMVWIHGGGYRNGNRMDYIAAPLAAYGDVIVVTVNYRLGIFGFLYEGPGWYIRSILGYLTELISAKHMVQSQQALAIMVCGIRELPLSG